MYVCVCNAVTERHIHSAVAEGAQRMRDLHRQLGVAAQCGRCATCAHQCLKEALTAGASCARDDLPQHTHRLQSTRECMQ